MKYVDLPHENAALAIFPTTYGFGWILFGGPLSLVRRGLSSVAKSAKDSEDKNARCMKQIEKILREFTPPVVVLEAFEGKNTKRASRIQRLCRSIISASAMSGATTRIFTREEITQSFPTTKPNTRYEVAEVVASYLPRIRRLLPNKRRAWDPEFPNMALFNAAALLIVHYATPATKP